MQFDFTFWFGKWFGKSRIFLVFGFLFFCFSAAAQPVEGWLKAKVQMSEKKYDQALISLEPFIGAANPDLSAASIYFSALALYYKAEPLKALSQLKRLKDQYPAWPAQLESSYLEAQCYFLNKKYSKAMQIIKMLEDEKLPFDAVELQNTKKYFMAKAPADTLKALRQMYSKDADLAQTNISVNPAAQSADPNQPLRIAVLLPLELGQSVVRLAQRPNQLIIDFLQGLELAAKALEQSSGKTVQLYVYDTQKRAEEVERLAGLPEMAQMDMLIGPVYSYGAASLATLAQNAQIPMINPLSAISYWPANNPWVYMAESLPSTTARVCYNFAAQNFNKGPVGIIFGTATKDSIMANQYLVMAKKSQTELALYKRVAKKSAGNLIKFIVESKIDSSASHFFVPSQESLVKYQFMAALDILKKKIPMISYDSWLEPPVLPEQLQRHNAYLICPHYAEAEKPIVQNFSKKYGEQYGLPPNKAAFQGYDCLMFFGTVLIDKKDQTFAQALQNASPWNAGLFSGFDYRNQAIDNQLVPLYNFQDYNMIWANKP